MSPNRLLAPRYAPPMIAALIVFAVSTLLPAPAKGQGLGVARDTRRPNIIIIMADDLGFSDLGCYGSEIPTPNIDRLADGGLRFTQFYNCGRCCPSRASMMTGLYPHMAGMGHMITDFHRPGYQGSLNQNCATIASLLRHAGYETFMTGKWHLTLHVGPTAPKHTWPLQRGFDHFYGIIHGAGSYFDPTTLARENQYVSGSGYGYYLTEAISKRSAEFIAEAARSDKPFFLFASYSAPHWPLHAPEQAIARYRSKYVLGWDAIREDRYRRQLADGIISREWQLSPRDQRVPAWEREPYRSWQQQRMAIYAAQVDIMDQGVGTIMEALKQAGAERDTLVMFLSDNGGSAEEVAPNWSGPHIPTKSGAGKTVIVGNSPRVVPGGPETYQSYGVGWANVSNTPFRGFKQQVYEGGISTPMIAYWPGRIPPGKKTDEIGHVIDIMPTCLEVARTTYPSQFGGFRLHPVEGRSLTPIFEGTRRTPITYFWEHEGNCAVRDGKWKMVCKYPGGWELYDIVADRTETNNLATKPQYRFVMEEMLKQFRDWGSSHQVETWRGPAAP